jgi:hypothetical protein
MKLLDELKYLSHLVNALLKQIDPEYHKALLELDKKLKAKYPASAALKSVDPLLPVG